ncbi:MAG TPA: sugar transferase, partial [Mucilaginibacter sp.]
YASVFLKGGLTLNPANSLINNIGHGGTGVHSNIEGMYQTKIAQNPIKHFPDEIKEDQQAYEAIRHFLKYRKGSLIQRGVRYIVKLKVRYFAKK